MSPASSGQNVQELRSLMKKSSRFFGWGVVLGLLLPFAARAQSEPVIGADITSISVVGDSGSILQVSLRSGGSGYTAAPTVTVSGGGGSGAVLAAEVSGGAVSRLTVVDGGSGYTSFPTITFSSPGVRATAVADTGTLTVLGALTKISLGNGGSGYTSAPSVTISGGDGTGAVATAVVADGKVTAITLSAGGSGYTSTNPPTVTISPPGADATAVVVSLGTNFEQPFQNESFGPVGAQINITAQAYGTYPVGGFTYNFFVNGVGLGTSVNLQPPGGGPGIISWAPVQPGSYLLTVVASDGAHTVTTLAIRYFATGTAIIGPVDNSLVPSGSSVVLQATATPAPSGPNAFVQRMDFYVDNVLVGSDSTYPYSYIYTPAASPTTHVVEARGFDNNGNQISPNGSATRRISMVTPIGTPPVVRIVNPPDGGNIAAGTSVNVIADAVAPDGFIRKVEFYLNGILLNTSQVFPFTSNWTPQVPGRYQFVAIGYDDKSNAVASAPILLNVTGAFPTASITSPERNGLTVVQGSVLPVTVRAAGPDGGVVSLKSIEFLVDGVVNDSLPKATTGTTGATAGVTAAPVLAEPFVFNWKSNVAIGTHRLSVRVTGLTNLSVTSSEVTVNVVANQPPRIAITSPTASTGLVMNSPAVISTSPADSDGTVELVEFFVNGSKVGSATKSPFQFSWTPSSSGTFDLSVRATDDGGATADSAVLSVIVDPPATTGSNQPTVAYSVYRGDYGSVSESGRFAFAVGRNNRGTFVGYSTAPAGRTYIWTDIPVNSDGTFSVRESESQVVLNGQVSATGVSGTMSGKTFIGPVTPSGGTFTPLMVTGTLTGLPNTRAVAIVGGDGSVTIYTANGNSREVGTSQLGSTGTFGYSAATGGRYAGTVANSASIVSGTVSGAVSGSFLLRLQPSRISNISTRTLAGSGDRTLVAGFVVAGSGTKPLLIRAVGPTLANFGVANNLADPDISVLSRTAALVAFNADWGNSAALAALASQVGAFPLTPGSRDASVQFSAAPGSYTAVVGGGTTVPASALVEIYDTETSSSATSRISNISTRGQIASGDTLIAGFVIAGDVRKRVLIRAVGPTLASFGLTGVIADPKIDVFAEGTLIASNNDWTERAVASQVTSVSSAVGAFPLAAAGKDAATVLQLPPGSYTVQVAGVGNSSGMVLVEIYDADP